MRDTLSFLEGIFSLSGEAALIVKKGRIVFMNQAAKAAFGRDMTGETVLRELNEELLSRGSGRFATTAIIGGRRASVAASAEDGIWAFLISFKPEPRSPLVISAAVPVIGSLLATIALATDRAAQAAKTIGDERLDKCVRILNKSYHQLSRQLKNITVLAESYRGELTYLPMREDLMGICRAVVDGVALYAPERGISVSLTEQEEDCAAVMDGVLIEQMLLNIVQNSLQHTPAGGSVRISLIPEEKRITIFVDDDGCGMEPEVMATAFSRWREPMELGDSTPGSGAGLAVARAIAERHGGALLIESGKGRGTSVRVLLPRDNIPAIGLREAESGYFTGQDSILTGLADWLRAENFSKEWQENET